jgi:hypothetical protein
MSLLELEELQTQRPLSKDERDKIQLRRQHLFVSSLQREPRTNHITDPLLSDDYMQLLNSSLALVRSFTALASRQFDMTAATKRTLNELKPVYTGKESQMTSIQSALGVVANALQTYATFGMNLSLRDLLQNTTDPTERQKFTELYFQGRTALH